MVANLDAKINLNETDEINTYLDKLKSKINQSPEGVKAFDNAEQIEKYVEPQVIIDAMFSYLKKEVKYLNYLSSEIKKEISAELEAYLSKHHILVIGKDGKMRLVVDDDSKKDFVIMSKKIVNIIKNEIINNKVIKSLLQLGKKYGKVINYFDRLYNYFDNLDNNLYNMPGMKYMEIMFGYVGGIVKEVLLKEKSGNMTIGEFYDYISGCYANKHGKKISEIMSKSHKKGDIKPIKYVSVTDATWIGPDDD